MAICGGCCSGITKARRTLRIEKRPSGVLIDDVALEVRCVPFHGLGNVAHTDGNVIERIEDGSAF